MTFLFLFYFSHDTFNFGQQQYNEHNKYGRNKNKLIMLIDANSGYTT
jgi:hypothetical protein